MTQTPGPEPDTTQCTHLSADGSQCSGQDGHEPLTATDGSTWAHGRPEFGHYWIKVSDRPGAPVDTTQDKPMTGEDTTAPITITVEIELELSPDEVWPDGDMPTGWTPADVMKRVLEAGTFRRFLTDWDADTFGADVSVHARGRFVNGHLH